MESFEKIIEGDYKYDFLQDKNISEDVGFVAHCDRPDWGEEKRDTLFLEEPKEKRCSCQYMSLTEASNFLYGKIECMTHRHRERRQSAMPREDKQ